VPLTSSDMLSTFQRNYSVAALVMWQGLKAVWSSSALMNEVTHSPSQGFSFRWNQQTATFPHCSAIIREPLSFTQTSSFHFRCNEIIITTPYCVSLSEQVDSIPSEVNLTRFVWSKQLLSDLLSYYSHILRLKNSMAWVRERTIPPSDRRLSAKLVPTFADRRCQAVSVIDLYGRILGFLDRTS
jgi:hypothetical protein